MPEAILLQDVESLGERGAVVDVSKGYLRNYLLPRKLAAVATKGALAEAQGRVQAQERAVAVAHQAAEEQAATLSKTVLTIAQQAGDDGRLFGSVTNADIADGDPGGPRPRDRPPQDPPRGADPQRRHVHGRGRGR